MTLKRVRSTNFNLYPISLKKTRRGGQLNSGLRGEPTEKSSLIQLGSRPRFRRKSGVICHRLLPKFYVWLKAHETEPYVPCAS